MDAPNAPVSDDPVSDQPVSDASVSDVSEAVATSRPAGSWRRAALLGSASVLAGAAILAAGVWLARKPIAEAVIAQVLAGRGVPAGVSVEQLRLDGAVLGPVRIGAAGKETAQAGSAKLGWAWNSSLDRLEVRVSEVTALHLRLALGPDGLDLGALAPLLEPTGGGPAPVFVDAIDIRQARIDLATPEGLLTASADVKGAQDRLDIVTRISLPATATGASGPQTLPLWLAVRQPGRSGRSVVGFHATPRGLDVRRNGIVLSRLGGTVTGAAVLPKGGMMRVDVQPSVLSVAGLAAPGVQTGAARIAVSAATITPGPDPARTLAASAGARISGSDVRAGAARLTGISGTLGLVRASEGAVQLSWDGIANGAEPGNGPIRRIGEVRAQLAATGLIPDLAVPQAATGNARIDLAARDASLARAVVEGLPQPWSLWLNGPVAATTTLEAAVNSSRVVVSLATPLQLRVPAGTVAFTPTAGLSSAVSFEADEEGSGPIRWSVGASASGRIVGRLGGTRLDARLDGATLAVGRLAARLGPTAWSELPLEGLITSGSVEEGNLVIAGGRVSGQGRGQVTASGTLADGTRIDRLQARFDGSGDARAWQASGTAEAARIALPGGEAIEGARARFDANGDARRWRLSAAGQSARLVSPAATGSGLQFDLALLGQGPATAIRASGTATSVQVGATGMRQVRFAASGASDGQTLYSGDLTASAASVMGPDLRGLAVAVRGPVTVARRGEGATGITFDLDAQGLSLAAGPVGAASARLATRGGLVLAGARIAGDFALDGTAVGVRQGETSARSVRLDTRLGLQGSNGRFALRSLSGCVPAILDGVEAGGGRVNTVNVDICPQAGAPLLAFGNGAPQVSASAAISPVELVMAASPDLPDGVRQSLRLGPSRLEVVNGPAGPRYALTATSLTYALPLEAASSNPPADPESPPSLARSATVSSNDAKLEIIPVANGFRLEGTLASLSTDGLPVSASGSATASLLASDAGLTGSFELSAITLRDPQTDPAFGTMILNGSGLLQPDRVTIDGVLNEARTGRMVAGLTLDHVLSQAAGSVTANINRLEFDPRLGPGGIAGLQPDDLSPRLRGLITSARGMVSGRVSTGWASGRPLSTGATMTMERFSFATGAGTITNLDGTVALDDLLTQRTAGVQRLTIEEFNPGVPLRDGDIRFALPGDGSMRVDSATWPFSGGRLLVDPTVLVFNEASQSFNVRVDGINLDSFLQLTGIRQLEVSGTASGVFPIVLTGNTAAIQGGYLEADSGGGLLRYTGPDPSPPPPPPTWWQRLTRQSPPPPQGLGLAVAALRNLDYRVLRLTVDGPLTGDIDVGVTISGSNRDVLGGAPFAFNVVTNVPLAQLLSLRRYQDPQWYADQLLEQYRLDQQRQRMPPAQ